MDKFPICCKEQAVGELTIEKEPLYTCFTVRASLPGDGIWSAWLIGTGGELRLGVLEPEEGGAMIRRRFSNRMASPVGKPLRGEIRPAAKTEDSWEPARQPETLFHSRNLSEALKGQTGILVQQNHTVVFIAIPHDKGNPFPLPDLFCFAELLIINGHPYLGFCFDREERIVFREVGRNSMP